MRNEAEALFLRRAEEAPGGKLVPITRKLGTVLQIACLAILSLACMTSVYAQGGQTTSAVRGIVTDATGALVPGAKVTISSKTSNYKAETLTTSEGEYRFSDLIPGDYSITIEAANFKTLTLSDVRAELGRVADVPAQLQAGAITETVNVSAGGAELVETTTTQLSKSFNERQVVELAQTNVGGAFGGGVNNLALLAPGVTSSGGVGVGTGGSVGGQRPRNNNFVLDGIDNNDKSVTGPQTYVSPETVAEFTLIQNQFSAEYARSNGGQFITVTKSGTNDFHGSFYGFFRNRYLNALDTSQKVAGITRDPADGDLFMPRSDYFRGGANVGGPIYLPNFGEGPRSVHSGKDRLFFFASYERLQTGSAAAPGGITTPTAQGFTILNSIPGLSATNLGVFRLYTPVAPINDAGFVTVNGVNVPIGNVTFAAPNFLKQNNVVTNIDYNQSTKTTHRWRFNMTNQISVDTTANLPVFYVNLPAKQRLFSYSLFHTFTSNLSNETRIAYRRSEGNVPVGPQVFPGLDAFPNIGLGDLGLNIGPNGNAPQTGIENNYQIVDNLTYLVGNHSLKFGGDFRKLISPQRFVQRERGNYEYSTLDLFLRDVSPDLLGQRNVGGSTYYGDQKILYAFVQDDWRIRPNVTLNLGVSYSYQEMPKGTRDQALNAISSVPGVIEFREPKTQMKNFAPKFGIVYAPNFTEGLLGRVFGSNGKSSIRAGFSMGYDYLFDNLYTLSPPPQAQQTVDIPDLTAQTPNFLAQGGISPIPGATGNDPVASRLATSSFIPDQEVPYSLTWSLSIQRQFRTNWSAEVRYIGTRGIHLVTQNRINRVGKVGIPGNPGLPTFLSAPTQAQIDALPLNLATINARTNFAEPFRSAGFTGNSVIAFLSNGNSSYHGASAQLTRRFDKGFQMTAAYTWSHLIDDTTAEVFSTDLTSRRVEEFQELRRERADSALDRRHRFVMSSIYELPFFRNSSNKWVRTILGGFNFAGTWTVETGEKATVLSGVDANLNGDAAGDRAIRNPAGVRNTSSTVSALLRTCTAFNVNGTCAQTNAARTVGYVANNPNAEYIQAGPGAVSNSARNTLALPGINNVDFSIFKNFRFGETKRIQLRADLFNAFNHPQYIPGSLNDVAPVNTVGTANVNTIGRAEFNRPDLIFVSNARVIQMALRFDF
ncbi:MAG TPA: carboxypeptidase regulatory-like domain-containing protein [Pyrinomonadaceae bacterium]